MHERVVRAHQRMLAARTRRDAGHPRDVVDTIGQSGRGNDQVVELAVHLRTAHRACILRENDRRAAVAIAGSRRSNAGALRRASLDPDQVGTPRDRGRLRATKPTCMPHRGRRDGRKTQDKPRFQGRKHVLNILLVYPCNPDSFWSFKHVLKFVSKKSAFPPLGLLTVAAMLPRGWNLKLVDLNVSVLEDADLGGADYVFLSGMIVHKRSAHEVAARCAALGKTVIAGGPLFTTGHQDFPEIGHFVLGEAEGVVSRLVADMEQGSVQSLYRAQGWP